MAEGGPVVLKNNQVELGQPRRLGTAAAPSGAAAPRPQARIVEQNDAGAIIELVCTCGRKTHLQCEYAAPSASPPVQAADRDS